MFSILAMLCHWLVGLAVRYLPASPFASLTVSAQYWDTALGWLNWLVPVSDMLGVFDAWLLCVSGWMFFRWLYGRMGGIIQMLTGGTIGTGGTLMPAS